MPDAPRIAHVGIAVSDLDAAAAFYSEILGLSPHAPEVADGATIMSFPLGESEIEQLRADGHITDTYAPNVLGR